MAIADTANEVSESEQGVLLVGHGTRSSIGRQQFLHLSQRFAHKLAPTPVEPAFLELQQPDIETAVALLSRRGVRRITVVPLLLFAAGHAKEDIPQVVQAALRRTSRLWEMSCEIKQASHFGIHPALVELSQRRFEHALADKSPISGGECCLLLVGRGSHDENATAEMHEFARLRQQAIAGIKTRVAFLAMARPLLTTVLESLAASGVRRVILQPHLLFHGELLNSVEELVSAVRSRAVGTEWVVTQALADSPGENGCGTELLAKIMLDRYRETAIRIAHAGRDG